MMKYNCTMPDHSWEGAVYFCDSMFTIAIIGAIVVLILLFIYAIYKNEKKVTKK